MQREISNKITLGENLNPLRDVSNVPSINNVADLRNVFGKVESSVTCDTEVKLTVT